MVSMVFTSSPLIAQSSFVKRLRTNSMYSGSSWVPKSSIKVSYCVQQLSYKNVSVESSKSSFIQGDGFSAFSLPKSSRVLPISKSPSLNACLPGPMRQDKLDKSIYRFTAKQKGKDISFKEYEGKILLIVNIPDQSSEWTNGQIEYLNNLYDKYKQKEFEIIGFLYDKKEIAQGDADIDKSKRITKEEEIIKPQFPVFDKVVLNDKHIKHRHLHRIFGHFIDEEKRDKDVWYFLRKKSQGGGYDVEFPFHKILVDSEGIPWNRFDPLPVPPNPPEFEDPNAPKFKDPVEDAIKEYFL